mgnify:CR=1 FL=1
MRLRELDSTIYIVQFAAFEILQIIINASKCGRIKFSRHLSREQVDEMKGNKINDATLEQNELRLFTTYTLFYILISINRHYAIYCH